MCWENDTAIGRSRARVGVFFFEVAILTRSYKFRFSCASLSFSLGAYIVAICLCAASLAIPVLFLKRSDKDWTFSECYCRLLYLIFFPSPKNDDGVRVTTCKGMNSRWQEDMDGPSDFDVSWTGMYIAVHLLRLIKLFSGTTAQLCLSFEEKSVLGEATHPYQEIELHVWHNLQHFYL